MVRHFTLLLAAMSLPQVANAATNVDFNANLTSSCTLTVNTAGVMTASAGGTQIGSENAGGVAAVLAAVAIGSPPTVQFSAPSLAVSPAGWTDNSTKEIKYSSLLGANQAYTSSSSSFPLTALLDTFTINGRVTNSQGFAAGNYTLRTVVTCS